MVFMPDCGWTALNSSDPPVELAKIINVMKIVKKDGWLFISK